MLIQNGLNHGHCLIHDFFLGTALSERRAGRKSLDELDPFCHAVEYNNRTYLHGSFSGTGNVMDMILQC